VVLDLGRLPALCAVLPGVAVPFSSLPSVGAAEAAQLH
jgi:hypothetical protein